MSPRVLRLAVLAACLSATGSWNRVAAASAHKLTYHVVHAYPHDENNFTEGLEYRDGVLFESSGLYGHSEVLKENLKTGKMIQKINLPSSVFGEGITLIGGRLVQLTWESQLGFIYDAATLKRIGTFQYSGEGWGLTNDGRTIYMSDGTPVIRCLDPKTFTVTRTITVHDGSEQIQKVNELEWVKGVLYANVWHEDRIARIDPSTGAVTAWIDLTGLRPKEATNAEAVPNGIAYDPATGHLLITGKLWPKLFEISIEPKR